MGKGRGIELCVLGDGGSGSVDGFYCIIYVSDEIGNV